MAGSRFLGMGVESSRVSFFIGRIGDHRGDFFLQHPGFKGADILMENGYTFFKPVVMNIFFCQKGQLLLDFNPQDFDIGVAPGQDQGHDAATAAKIQNRLAGCWEDMARQYDGIHGKTVALLGLADGEV